jgi:hypothetical protein
MNYGNTHSTSVKGPSTPEIKVGVNPTPARITHKTNLKVERPSFKVNHFVPGQVVQASGSTKVLVDPQPKYDPKGDGKGAWVVVNLSRDPSSYTSTTEGSINWPTNVATAQSNVPFAYDSTNEATVQNPTRAVDIEVKPNQLGYPGGAGFDGVYKSSASTTVPIGR